MIGILGAWLAAAGGAEFQFVRDARVPRTVVVRVKDRTQEFAVPDPPSK